jgi:hypothetical protein
VPEIRVRYASDGVDLDPEQVISLPALGPTDADSGLAAGGDIAGDAAIAWVQGTGIDTQIVAAQLYQTPGGFVPANAFRYATSVNPILAWSPSSEQWGVPTYTVDFDGTQIAETTATELRTPMPVAQGRHSWQVIATNQAGLSTAAPTATVFVDTLAPRVSVRITGTRRVGSTLRIHIRDTDSPPPIAPSTASGIKSAQVKWGDGAKPFIGNHAGEHVRTHVYRHRGSYLVTVTVKDRAGNRTVVHRRLKIRPTLQTSQQRGRRR